MFESGSNKNEVFRNKKYLETGYQPEKPVGRTNEIDRIVEAVRPVTKGRSSESLLVCGSAGIGKTACVKYVLGRLNDETTSKAVYINCWKYNTRSSLLSELIIKLGYPMPRKGKPVDRLLSKLRALLDNTRGIAVVLDEFDQLRDATEIIYDIQMMNEQSDSSLGLVMVSNQELRDIRLDPRSESRLNHQTVRFEPYTEDELEQILKERVEQAFQPGSVPNEVIQKIAEHVATENGDCRKALDLLLYAGRQAEQEGKTTLSMEDFEFTALS